jgi:thiol-disulfide isomerase/thioredoxin
MQLILIVLLLAFEMRQLATAWVTSCRHRPGHYTSTAQMIRRSLASVSGTIYSSPLPTDPQTSSFPVVVTLFTKEGCTLCDKVVDVLFELRSDYPHSLVAVDITDGDQGYYWGRYKYDIPVLHLNSVYWTKHRLTKSDAQQALTAAAAGTWQPFPNAAREEPNAAQHER